MVRERPPQALAARPSSANLTESLWAFFVEGVVQHLSGKMRGALYRACPRTSMSSATCVPAIVVYDGVSSRIVFTEGKAMGRRSLQKAAAPLEGLSRALVDRFYPYVRHGEEGMLLSPPTLTWPQGPDPDGTWPSTCPGCCWAHPG
jgi:hypothetical protein